MKHKASYLAKALSVCLAVVMCLSAFMMDWSGILPTADAALASGTYLVKIWVTVTNTDKDSKNCSMTVYGKGNNGTGTEVAIISQRAWNGNSSGSQTLYSGYTTIFPTSFSCYGYTSSEPDFGFAAYVSVNDTTIMQGSASKTSGSDAWGHTISASTADSAYPVLTSMTGSGETSYTLNPVGGDTITSSYGVYPVDQYGIQMVCTPSWTLSDANYPDASISSTSANITTLSLPATPRNMAKTSISITGTCTIKNKSLSHKFDIAIQPTYKVNFNATQNGGTLSGAPSSATVVNNTSSTTYTYTIPSTYRATKSGWTFLGWSPTSTAQSGTAAGQSRTINYNNTLYALFSRSISANFYYTTASNNVLNAGNYRTKTAVAYNAATTQGFTSSLRSDVTTMYTQNDRTYELIGWQAEGATAPTLVAYNATPAIGFGSSVNVLTSSSTHNFYPVYRLYSTKFYASFNYYRDGEIPSTITNSTTVNAPQTIGLITLPYDDTVEFYIKDGIRYQLVGWSRTPGDTTPEVNYGESHVTLDVPSNNTEPVQFYPIYVKYSTVIYASFHYFDASGNDAVKEMNGNCFVPQTTALVSVPKASDITPSYFANGRTYTLLGWRTADMAPTEYLPYGSQFTFDLPEDNQVRYQVYPVYISSTKATFNYYNADGSVANLTKTVNELDSVNGGYTRNTITMPIAQAGEINTTIVLDGRTFTFCGWNKNTVSEKQRIETSVTNETLNITDAVYQYYAIYKSDDLTLSYNGINGAPIPASQKATQYINAGTGTANINNASSYTFNINPDNVTPEKVGYTYIGWQNANNAETETQTYSKTGDTYTTKVNHTLYAVYSIDSRAVRYVYYKGNGFITETDYVLYDDETRSDSGATRYTSNAPTMDTSVIDHADLLNHYYFTGWTRSDGKALEPSVNGNIYNLKVRFVTDNITVQALYNGVAHHWVTLPGTTVQPTCTENGHFDRQCADCGYIEYDVQIEALGHLPFEEGAKAATCEEDGRTAAVICSRCNAVVVPHTVIPAIGHDYETTVFAPTCSTQGYTLYTCKNNTAHHYKDNFTTGGGHDYSVVVEGTPATCTQPGLTDYSYCSMCGAQNVAQAIIPKLGHSMTKHEELDATCTEDGNILYFECSTCNKFFADKNGAAEIADANDDGVITVDDTVIAATGHNYDTQPEVAATCTTAGHSAGYCCEYCGEGAEVTIYPALGHDYDGVEPVVVPSTCTVNGTSTLTCNRCNEDEVTELELLAHTVETVEAVAATCTEYGKTAWTKCSVCDETLTSFEYTAKISHDYSEVVTPAVAPTCTVDGSTDELKCSVCGDVKAAEVVYATGHSFGSWKVSVPAVCGVAGEAQRACLVCKEVDTEEIPALEHEFEEVDEVPATCTEDGLTSGVKCSVCGEVQSGFEVIKALGHDLGTPEVTVPATCLHTGRQVAQCSKCDYTEITELPLIAHTETEIPEVPATCSTIGYTAGVKCSVCDSIITRPTAVKKQAHTEMVIDGIPATCTATGTSSYNVCSVCGQQLTISTVIQATGHTMGDWILDLAATCSANGLRVRYCQNDGCTYHEERVLEKIGHKIVTDAAVAPTCTETGLTEGSHCTRCNEATVVQAVVSALGHDMYENVVPPTCLTDGYTISTCAVCNETETGAVTTATGHTGGTPTCAVAAICTVCGEEYGGLLSHDYTITNFDGSCISKSRIVYNCNLCGDTYTIEGEYGDHTYLSATAVVTLAPTCTNNGVSTNICQMCGESENFTILATGDHTDLNADKYCDECNLDLDPASHGVTNNCDLCGMNHSAQGGFFGRNGIICRIRHFMVGIVSRFG